MCSNQMNFSGTVPLSSGLPQFPGASILARFADLHDQNFL